MKNGNSIEELVQRMFEGDVRSLSRLMTLVERSPESLPDVMALTWGRRRRARRIAFAGPPGAGKSSLIANLVRQVAGLGLRAGVLCVDPTSPVTGGAILGDRVRMASPDFPADTFIRSVASGDSLGGLAAATRFHTFLLDAFGVDMIIVETVGIGQIGYDARLIADTLVLTLVPESGDTVQSLKSGILELADIVVVNKADRDGAEEIADTIRSALDEPRDGRRVPVILTSAARNEGIAELWAAAEEHRLHLESKPDKGRRAPLADLREALVFIIRGALTDEFFQSRPELKTLADKAESGETDPFSAAREIWRSIIGGNH